MSRVVTFSEYGGPEVLDIEDIEVAAPGTAEVRIRVKAIGLNRAESMWRSGNYVEPVRLPARLGYESAGEVESVGSEVHHVKVGDSVSTIPSFSLNDYGMYGELVLAPAHAVVKHESFISFEDATAIWNPLVTPYGAFVESGALRAGDTVLISAASSSVGIGAIQVAKMIGAIPIALTRTRGKRERLLEEGAAHVVVTGEQDLVAEVLRITGGKGAKFAFDPVGGTGFPKLVASMAEEGTIFVYGALADGVTPLPMLEVLAKRVVIRGYNLFATTTDPARQKAATEFIFDGIRKGALKPVIDKRFRFDEIREAHRELEKNQHFGRIVVVI
jgi:NADPH:quinone reductase-like Zn-dependent oxidoreductase